MVYVVNDWTINYLLCLLHPYAVDLTFSSSPLKNTYHSNAHLNCFAFFLSAYPCQGPHWTTLEKTQSPCVFQAEGNQNQNLSKD